MLNLTPHNSKLYKTNNGIIVKFSSASFFDRNISMPPKFLKLFTCREQIFWLFIKSVLIRHHSWNLFMIKKCLSPPKMSLAYHYISSVFIIDHLCRIWQAVHQGLKAIEGNNTSWLVSREHYLYSKKIKNNSLKCCWIKYLNIEHVLHLCVKIKHFVSIESKYFTPFWCE